MARSVTADEVGSLFDLLASRGVTKPEMCAHLEIGARRMDDVIRKLREVLGDDDTINLVAIPQHGGPWLYCLVGTYADAKVWTTNRTLDARSRLQSVNQVIASIARGADGRTTDGKMVRIVQRTIARAMEDLAELL